MSINREAISTTIISLPTILVVPLFEEVEKHAKNAVKKRITKNRTSGNAYCDSLNLDDEYSMHEEGKKDF